MFFIQIVTLRRYARAGGQPRCACAWFPCVDTPAAASPFELAITVGAGELAVAPGRLTRQTAGAGGRRTLHFRLAAATAPAHVALAVGPFTVVPGSPASQNGRDGGAAAGGAEARAGAGGTLVTHLGPPGLRAELAHGARFAPLAFDLFETFLGCPFPFPAFHAVSVPPGAAPARVHAAAGMQIASADLLYSGRAVEAAMEARVAGARALARQWFGVWLRPAAPADAWLLEGLAGYLEDLFVRRFMGRNELAYRRAKEREAIHLADDGAAPPLYVRGPAYPWGALHATEELGPGAALLAWKATAVVGMLERRVGEDTFKRLLERHMVASCAAGAPAGARPGSAPKMSTVRMPCSERPQSYVGSSCGSDRRIADPLVPWSSPSSVLTQLLCACRRAAAGHARVPERGGQGGRLPAQCGRVPRALGGRARLPAPDRRL